MKTVQDILDTKGNVIWSVAPDDTVFDALNLMASKNIGVVLVLDRRKLVGICSERDYARSVILLGKASKTTNVEEIMHREVLYVRPEQSLEDCMALMSEKHLRHLPVLEDDRLIGLISILDVVRAIITKQDYKIKQLENYITGREHYQPF